jgi:hypothetical protein
MNLVLLSTSIVTYVWHCWKATCSLLSHSVCCCTISAFLGDQPHTVCIQPCTWTHSGSLVRSADTVTDAVFVVNFKCLLLCVCVYSVTNRTGRQWNSVSEKVCSHVYNLMSLIPQSVLRHVHRLFQSQFSTECDIVFPLSVSSIL